MPNFPKQMRQSDFGRSLCMRSKRLVFPDIGAGLSPNPEGRAVDSTVDAARVLSLVSTMLFPASLIPEGEIMMGVGQHMPFSFLPELEGDAIRLEDFLRRVAEVSSPLVRCFRAPEPSLLWRLLTPMRHDRERGGWNRGNPAFLRKWASRRCRLKHSCCSMFQCPAHGALCTC
jgi:hypothetical protein